VRHNLELGDITEFSAGAALGGLLLCGGIVLGLLLGRWLAHASSAGLSSDDVLKIVTQLRHVTHGVAEDMSQYREVMDLAQRRIRDLKQNPVPGDDSALQLLRWPMPTSCSSGGSPGGGALGSNPSRWPRHERGPHRYAHAAGQSPGL
jgi:hypothetical protein